MKTTFIVLLSGLLLCGCSKKQATNDYPNDSWAFVGYARPDSALESWTWALSRDDTKVMLQSLTPEAQKAYEKLLAGQTDAQRAEAAKAAARIPGYTIQKREVIADDDVIITMSITGTSEVMKMEFKKIGNDWKLVGPKSS